MKTTGKAAFLTAFDRLFDAAADKLNITCTADEKNEARRVFAKRFRHALQVADDINLPRFPAAVMAEMEAAIEDLSPAAIAGRLAAGPLTRQVHELARALALRTAEQRLIEHLAAQADDRYGGN